MTGLLVAALAAQIVVLDSPRELMVGETVTLAVTRGGAPLAGVEVRLAGDGRMHGLVLPALLNVRSGPDRMTAPRASLYRGERVMVLAEGADGWCRIITPAGREGFSACEFLELAAVPPTLGRTDADGRLSAAGLTLAPGDLVFEAVSGDDVLARVTVRVRPFEYDRRETVAPGISYRERRLAPGGDGPFTFQMLEVDPRHPAVNLLAARARDRAIGRETVSAMAKRYGATAAVNGGYFVTTGPYAGASTGLYAGNDGVVASPGGAPERTALLLCEGRGDVERLEFAAVGLRASVTSSTGATTTLSGVNRERGAADLILYRPAMGERTLTGADGVEARVDAGGRVTELEERGGSMAIPRDGYVLSGAGAAAEWLRRNAWPGARLALDMRLEGTPCAAEAIIGGGPRLVRDGRVDVAEEGFAHQNVRHPRTAVALAASGTLLFVTLDGRQPGSAGMTLGELARALVELGAREAMNLDGGGSTTMLVRDRVRNSPSDGAERPVSDALLIYSVSTAEELAKLRRILGDGPVVGEAERGVRAISSASGERTRGWN